MTGARAQSVRRVLFTTLGVIFVIAALGCAGCLLYTALWATDEAPEHNGIDASHELRELPENNNAVSP